MFTPGRVIDGTDSYVKGVAIVLADADQWPNNTSGARPPRAILCLTAGNCKFNFWEGGGTFTVPAVAGQILNFQPSRVWSTGTTGTYAAIY